MQEKLVKFTSKDQDQTFIIPASKEQDWKQNFSEISHGDEDISSYQREEADYFQVEGRATSGRLNENYSTQRGSGSRQNA